MRHIVSAFFNQYLKYDYEISITNKILIYCVNTLYQYQRWEFLCILIINSNYFKLHPKYVAQYNYF